MDLRRLDLNLLLVFDALMLEGGVTAAARRLKLSQPTVSVALAKLRTALNDELFIRSGGAMRPTARALRLHDPVRRIIETVVEEILPAEQFDPAAARRPFTFCLSDVGEMVFLPPIMQGLRETAPHAPVVSVSLRPAELRAALEAGQVDLAIGYFPDLEGGIFQQALFEHAFVCLARHDHPRIAGKLTLETFMALDHLVVSAEGRSQEIFERVMLTRGDSRRVALRTPHFLSAPLIVGETDVITIVPKAVGLAWAARGSLRILEPPLPIPPIPLKQFWHRRFHDDARLSWLRSFIAERFVGRDPSAT